LTKNYLHWQLSKRDHVEFSKSAGGHPE